MLHETALTDRCAALAATAHRDHVRKDGATPYIAHPVSVALRLAQCHASAAVIGAALLHDAVEDTELSLDEIRAAAGDEVARLVEATTERDKSLGWRARKRDFLAAIRDRPDLDAAQIIAADKTHNLLCIAADARDGDPWRRLNAPPADQEWFHRNLCDAFRDCGYRSAVFTALEEAVRHAFDDALRMTSEARFTIPNHFAGRDYRVVVCGTGNRDNCDVLVERDDRPFLRASARLFAEQLHALDAFPAPTREYIEETVDKLVERHSRTNAAPETRASARPA